MTTAQLESAGFVAAIDRDGTPEVDAGATATGLLSLRLDPSFQLDDAVLSIGRPENRQAHVPLGESGELVLLTPVAYQSLGDAADAVSTVTIEQATVSWDTADPRAQSAVGAAFLTINWTLESAVGTALNDDVLTLRLPSGAEVEPVKASTQQLDAGEVATGLTAVFEVDDPALGEYVLEYAERFGNGVVEIAFVLN